MRELIDRQAAIDAFKPYADYESNRTNADWVQRIELVLHDIPSAQPTLHGYNIEHLELIARVLQKEDLPPERVVEVLTDIGRIIDIARCEKR